METPRPRERPDAARTGAREGGRAGGAELRRDDQQHGALAAPPVGVHDTERLQLQPPVVESFSRIAVCPVYREYPDRCAGPV